LQKQSRLDEYIPTPTLYVGKSGILNLETDKKY